MASQVRPGVIPVIEQIPPQSVADGGTINGDWFDVSKYESIMVIGNAGALGTNAFTVDFQQATSSGGAGAKSLAAWSGGALSVSDSAFQLSFDPALLDINNGFKWVRARLINNSGGGAALGGVTILGVGPRYANT